MSHNPSSATTDEPLTPIERLRLAIALTESYDDGVFECEPEYVEALLKEYDEQAETIRRLSATPAPGDVGEVKPYTWAHQYHDCIRFNQGQEVNGSRPTGTFAVYDQKTVDELRATISRISAVSAQWQPIETCPKADYQSYYLFNPLWEDSWSPVQRGNCFEGTWIFDSGLTVTDCEEEFNPIMWHPDTKPAPPVLCPVEEKQ